jgi:hypothetical protein
VKTVKIEVQQLLDRQCNQIRQACMDLKKSCQYINIAQELNNFIEVLYKSRPQLQSPLVIGRLEYFIQELERIVSECEQPSKKNSDNNLHRNAQIQNSVQIPPPLQLRQEDRQHALVNLPPYYQLNLGSERNSMPTTSEFPLSHIYSTGKVK